MISSLIVMCGIQCSGKSTQAKKLNKEIENSIIISSDKIRQKWMQERKLKTAQEIDNNEVFREVYNQINENLRYGKNVIFDATNITIKSRMQLFNQVKVPCKKICYIMNTPFKVCQARLTIRNTDIHCLPVPLEVLTKYYHRFEIPFYEEGWDEIIIFNHPDKDSSDIFLNDLLNKTIGFNQQNKYHNQTLDQHMQHTYTELLKVTNDSILLEASKVHDIGKLCTKTIDIDGNAHYYNHENIGTYILLCYCGQYKEFKEYDTKTTLKWLCYINYHMKLHQIKTDKAVKKWTNIFGKELYNKLDQLGIADRSREK